MGLIYVLRALRTPCLSPRPVIVPLACGVRCPADEQRRARACAACVACAVGPSECGRSTLRVRCVCFSSSPSPSPPLSSPAGGHGRWTPPISVRRDPGWTVRDQGWTVFHLPSTPDAWEPSNLQLAVEIEGRGDPILVVARHGSGPSRAVVAEGGWLPRRRRCRRRRRHLGPPP